MPPASDPQLTAIADRLDTIEQAVEDDFDKAILYGTAYTGEPIKTDVGRIRGALRRWLRRARQILWMVQR